jgi:acetyl esterase/lipase
VVDTGDEADLTKPEDPLIAGRRIIKLGHVKRPEAHVFLPPQAERNGTAVVVCPGGGFSILAWDLEGTEVAEWLNGLGVTAVVLKYRVPTRERDPVWLAPVQDAQRTLSLVREKAAGWGIDPARVGVLGFSAGGATAARAALSGPARRYEPRDGADEASCAPDFAVLVYTGGLYDRDSGALADGVEVGPSTPPVFFAHAADDRVPLQNSVLLFLKLQEAGVPSELHVYDRGGHGYGLRETDHPVSSWHHRCADWLRVNGWLGGGAGGAN